MVPAIFDAWVPAFLDLAAPEPGERMLDLACGTGVVARQAVSRVGSGGRLVGLDFNAGMLARARASEPAVEWQEGNAMALPFADDTFDVVVCQQALQFFPDAGKALEEVRRVLAPAGRFVAAVWCEIESSPGHHALARALERHVSAEAAGLMYSVFRLGDAQALEALLSTAGFQQMSVQRHQRLARFPSADAFARWVIVGSVLGRTGVQLADVALSAIVRDVTEALEPFSSAAGLIFPMEANLASARAPA
jgi:ubiquinone/menaquinone biosynthesis C-methylase UbiE